VFGCKGAVSKNKACGRRGIRKFAQTHDKGQTGGRRKGDVTLLPEKEKEKNQGKIGLARLILGKRQKFDVIRLRQGEGGAKDSLLAIRSVGQDERKLRPTASRNK